MESFLESLQSFLAKDSFAFLKKHYECLSKNQIDSVQKIASDFKILNSIKLDEAESSSDLLTDPRNIFLFTEA